MSDTGRMTSSNLQSIWQEWRPMRTVIVRIAAQWVAGPYCVLDNRRMRVAAQHSAEDAAAFLGRLECAPQGFGAPSALEFARRLGRRAGEQESAGPLVLFIIGEPMSGKSTFLSNLLNWLLNAPGADTSL